MNRLETISILFAAWLAVAFEISFNGFRNTLGAQVNLLPALMVYVALSSSLPSVALLAIAGGLAQDAFSANPLGVTTLALVLTGTPAGVGPFVSGDVVEVEIDGLGILRNTARDAEPRR